MMWLPFMPISCPVIIVPLRVHLTSSRMDCPIDNAFFFISAVPPTSFYTPSFVSWLENLEGGIFSMVSARPSTEMYWGKAFPLLKLNRNKVNTTKPNLSRKQVNVRVLADNRFFAFRAFAPFLSCIRAT